MVSVLDPGTAERRRDVYACHIVSFSSEAARTTQFSGTMHSYDAGEVEQFRARVVAALQEHERSDRLRAAGGEVAEAQRVRRRAVSIIDGMLREVMGTGGDPVTGLTVWQEAVILKAVAAEELEHAREESRLLRAIRQVEMEELRSRHELERTELEARLRQEAEEQRAAAAHEAAAILIEARDQAERQRKAATGEAERATASAWKELQRIERRVAVMQQALAGAEARFRRLAASAANEIGTLTASMTPPDSTDPVELSVAAVDLTERLPAEAVAADSGDDPQPVSRGDQSFYERRLAGLRERLERSGHFPEG